MKYARYIIAALLTIQLSSCNKFLTLTPHDTKVVNSVEDYRDILASFMRYLKTPTMPSQDIVMGVGLTTLPFYSSDVDGSLSVYTGEANLTTESAYYYDRNNNVYTQTGKNALTWLNTNNSAWNNLYNFLGPINLIINSVPTAEGTDENLRNRVLGEALTWRAYTFFKLLQLYSPMTDNELGVPVYLTPDKGIGEAMPERKTQKEVFDRILADCNEALALLEKTTSNDWNFAWNADFLHAMMASVYTWKACSGAAEDTDWDNADQQATTAMRGRNLTSSADMLKTIFDCSDNAYSKEIKNDEFYVRIVDGRWTYICDFKSAYDEDGGVVDGLVNKNSYRRFADNDIRRKAWFSADGTHNDKYNIIGSDMSQGCLMPFRLAEMYLIKAEALVRQGKTAEGKAVLDQLRSHRYTGELPAIAGDRDALLKAIRDERFRELYMEGDKVWLDMKRFGDTLERTIAGEKNRLEANDFRYCFPIPAREMEYNKKMKQNPGWESVIVY